MDHWLQNKRTRTLLWTLGGVFVVAVGTFMWAYANGSIVSSAQTLSPGVSSTTAVLSGIVTNKVTEKPISGAGVAVQCTNSTSLYSGTNESVKTGTNGSYSLNLITSTTYSVNVKYGPFSVRATKKTIVFTYNITASATGYTAQTVSGASWPKAANGSIVTQNFALQPTGTTGGTGGTGTGTLSGSLYVTANGVRDMACMAVHAGGVCTVNLNLSPSGEHQFTGIGRYSGNQPGPVTISLSLPVGTYQITGGNVVSTVTGGSYNLKLVNGSPLPYTITITSGGTKSVTLDFQ
ncbi:MAG: hypothetical protein ABSE91_01085 [Patescibacteria group bacterium]|jgi:hypothetical protein